MKTIIIALGIVFLMGVALELKFNNDVEVIKIETEEVIEEETPEIDVIDSAKIELERINTELDAEEVKLLQEIEERETRLESIRETRTSF